MNMRLGNWSFGNKIVSPVLVNLITAFLVFLSVVLFKEPIYKLLKPGQTVEEFPIYCVVEPYNNEEGEVISDLFIVNLRGKNYNENDLRTILKMSSYDQDVEIKPHIEIKWERSMGKIRGIKEDKTFNNGKGEIEIVKPMNENGNWIIKIKSINSKAILKLNIFTDYRRPITRGAKASLPFNYDYPGD